MTGKKRKLNYIFHNPNSPEVTSEFLVTLFIEVNMGKVEKAVREASEETAPKQQESMEFSA